VRSEAHLNLAPTVDAAAQARHFIKVTLFGWGRREAVALVDLVATELIANALVHGRGPSELELAIEGDSLHLAVTDYAPASQPAMSELPQGAEHGYGLHIVDALATTWGCSPEGTAKAVWADLDLNQTL
jgi:hypothetical protein